MLPPNFTFFNSTTNLKSLAYQIIYHPAVNLLLRNLNKTLSIIFPAVRIPPSGKIRLKLQNGKKILLYTNQTSHVTQVVFWEGLYAYEYIRLFEEVIAHCKGFVDIGANTGIYSLIAASARDDMQVLAFDPTEAAQYYLRKNIKANRFEYRIKPYQLAVSDTETLLTFYHVRNPKYPYLKFNLGGASSLINKPAHFEPTQVNAVQADSFILSHHPDMQIDFIKIDAEGAEPAILIGLQKIIEKWKPIIVCEVRFNESAKQLEAIFAKYNYGVYLFKSNQLVPTNNMQTLSAEVTDCFFIHPDKKHLIEKYIQY